MQPDRYVAGASGSRRAQVESGQRVLPGVGAGLAGEDKLMRVVVRWGLAIAISAGAFAASWWVCQERAGLDEGAALGVAGAVLAVVLTVAGWWAAREDRDWAGSASVPYKLEVVNPRVSRRILWIGAEAFPLQNIARAWTIELVPHRAAAIGRYVMVVALWVFLGAVAAVAFKAVVVVVVVVVIVALALIVISTITLIAALSRLTLTSWPSKQQELRGPRWSAPTGIW